MQCIYINLDAATARREQIERSFAERAAPGWTLRRQRAVPAAEAADLPGRLRAAEKACLTSHRLAVAQAAAHDGPTLILEDDALIGRRMCQLVDQFLAQPNRPDWDLLFTDICVPRISLMFDLVRRRRAFDASRQMTLIDLSGKVFAGTTAYIVTPRSAVAILERSDGAKSYDTPYDLIVREMVRTDELRGYVFFPFLSTLTQAADESSVQPPMAGSPDPAWNLFRRMVWIERDLDASRPALAELDREFGADDLRPFGALFASLASDRLQAK